jgi:hypothetical protein
MPHHTALKNMLDILENVETTSHKNIEDGQHPGVASSLLTLRLVFYGYYIMKLPVEDL